MRKGKRKGQRESQKGERINTGKGKRARDIKWETAEGQVTRKTGKGKGGGEKEHGLYCIISYDMVEQNVSYIP